jgi:phosphoglycerate kinase
MKLRTIKDTDLAGKQVLIRLDLNVPLKEGKIQDDTRLRAALPTLQYLLEQNAKIVIMTHFGRPKGKVVEDLRVAPIAKALGDLLGQEILSLDDCVGNEVETVVSEMNDGDIVMLENTRFHAGEKENADDFVEQLAKLGDVFVSDAFGTVHRAHASTCGLGKVLPAYAGLLVEEEVKVLTEVLESAESPLCLIVGGAKIDTKIGILEKFLDKADCFLIGGALANTFLAAEGFEVGDSLYQEDKIKVARDFLLQADSLGKEVFLSSDVVVADEISENAEALDIKIRAVAPSMKILDIGKETAANFADQIKKAGTVIWNGPMGLYEYLQFRDGTKVVADAIAYGPGKSIVGGGDSIDAINKLGMDKSQFDHISTGGGAMLEFLEGKVLPGLEVLMK